MSMAQSHEPAAARDAVRTRRALLDAAQHVFSLHGYSDASVRAITARAGVNISLVSRYFGSKEGLFEEALKDLLGTGPIVEADRRNFGQAMLDLLMGTTAPRVLPLPMIMMASSDTRARAISERLLFELVYAPLCRWFGPQEGAVRAARFMIVSAGLTVYCRLYPLDVLVPRPDPALIEWLTDQFQTLVE